MWEKSMNRRCINTAPSPTGIIFQLGPSTGPLKPIKMNVLYPTFTLLSVLFSIASAEIEGKRSFSELGCMGVYDKAKFTRLDRMCEECYQLYRETDVHTECRLNCFKNDHFLNCVDTLLYKKDSQQLDIMVEKLYGRRK